MWGGHTDAISDKRTGKCSVFHFDGVNFVASDVDDVVGSSGQMEASVFVDVALVVGLDDAVPEYLGGEVIVVIIAGHECLSFTGNGTVGSDEDGGILHGLADTALERFEI